MKFSLAVLAFSSLLLMQLPYYAIIGIQLNDILKQELQKQEKERPLWDEAYKYLK